MRRKIICAFVAVFLLSILLLSIGPSSDVPRTFAFSLEPSSSNTNSNQDCDIVVSNISSFPAEISRGSDTLWFTLSCRTNGTWNEHSTRTVDGGMGVIPPHTSVKSTVQIPSGIDAIKVGLNFTSLTWRGRIACGIIGDYPEFCWPAAGFLLRQDEKKRSGIEWSDVFLVRSNSPVILKQ